MSSNPAKPPQPGVPPLEIPDHVIVEYVNLVRISHSPSELVFDFGRILPGNTAPRATSRIIMSPLGAKLFLRALADNLAKYESAFGEIIIPGGVSLADQLFRPHPPSEPPAKE